MDRAERKRREEARNIDGRTSQSKKSRNAARSVKKRSTNRNSKGKSRNAITASRSPEDSTSPFFLTQDAIKAMATGVPSLPRAKWVSPPNNDTSHLVLDDVREKKVLILKLRVSLPEEKSNDVLPRCSPDTEASALMGVLGDGIASIRVIVMDDGSRTLTKRLQEEKEERDWIVDVRGYLTTKQIWNVKFQTFPLVCLTSIAILSTVQRTSAGDDKNGTWCTTTLGEPFTYSNTSSTKVYVGSFGSFLKQWSSFFTNRELAGSKKILNCFDDTCSVKSPLPETFTPRTPNEDESPASDSLRHEYGSASSTPCVVTTRFPSKCETSDTFASPQEENVLRVQQLLARHSSMITLQSSLSASSPPTSRPAEHAWELYNSLLREFTASQFDRQKASLSNAGTESADRAVLVAERHNAALAMAMKETNPLSMEKLCSWHKVLLQDLHPDAGTTRTCDVRSGLIVFARPTRIQSELEMFCDGLKSLEKRLDLTKALDAMLFAAMALYGVVDIHPFLVGNGRLSRIVANYALRKLPFPINLFATPLQRAEYVLAIEKTRYCLSFSMPYGDVSQDDLIQTLKCTGVFSFLVSLLMDRVARVAMECDRVWQEKSGLAAEAAEARVVRRARERASQGTCMICLEERPNVSTLCCGKPTHLNCMAEWLSGQTTCPFCRSEMPPISARVVRAAWRLNESSDEEEDDASLHDNDAERRSVGGMTRRHYNAMRETTDLLARVMRGEDATSTSDSDDEDPEDSTTTATSDDSDDEDDVVSTSSTTTSDDADEDESAVTVSTSSNDADFCNEASDDAINEGSPAEEVHPSRTCCAGIACRNRPAVDCTNSLCGRCCVLVGELHCSRHNA
jgi:fido (protein-threonine AMPylation protein)